MAVPAVTTCIDTGPGCTGAAVAGGLAPASGGWPAMVVAWEEVPATGSWATVALTEAATELGTPTWAVLVPEEEAGSQAGTMGETPDKVPADVPTPTKRELRGRGRHMHPHCPPHMHKQHARREMHYSGFDCSQWPQRNTSTQRKCAEGSTGQEQSRAIRLEIHAGMPLFIPTEVVILQCPSYVGCRPYA